MFNYNSPIFFSKTSFDPRELMWDSLDLFSFNYKDYIDLSFTNSGRIYYVNWEGFQ